jgi:Family of unknown function (DUF6262)
MPVLPDLKMQSDASATPQARRRARTEARLREALARLRHDGSRLTVAELAREARVSRNAIYANHGAILAELRRAATRQGAVSKAESNADCARNKRRLIAELKSQLQRLATENVALLKRALDAEASAARLDRRITQLSRELDQMRRPIPAWLKESI